MNHLINFMIGVLFILAFALVGYLAFICMPFIIFIGIPIVVIIYIIRMLCFIGKELRGK
jgi:hypothetical protein